MVLAEALMARKDLVKKIERIKNLVSNSLVTYKDIPLDVNIKDEMVKYHEKMDQLEEMNKKIDEANRVNISALSKLRILDSQLGFYKKLSEGLSNDSRLSFRSVENEMIKNMDIKDVESIIESLEDARREIDKILQKANWTIEI